MANSNEKNNDVTCFMYYIFNKWNLAEAKLVYGDNLGEHIYNKFLDARSALYWYSEIDTECKNKIVERAKHFYGQNNQ